MNPYMLLSIAILAAICAVALSLLLRSMYIVDQAEVAIISRLGKFSRVSAAGLWFKSPFTEKVEAYLDLRTQQLNVAVETLTKDNATVQIKVAVQYRIIATMAMEAFYTYQDDEEQIEAYVRSSILSHIPTIELNDVWRSRSQISEQVKNDLAQSVGQAGFDIVGALVTEIDTDEGVKDAMNRITAANRDKVAATAEGEANRIRIVAAAQADAEKKALEGKGLADLRTNYAAGLAKTIQEIVAGDPAGNIKVNDAMEFMTKAMAIDAIGDLSRADQTTTLVIPIDMAAMHGGNSTILPSLLTASAVAQNGQS